MSPDVFFNTREFRGSWPAAHSSERDALRSPVFTWLYRQPDFVKKILNGANPIVAPFN